MFKYYSTQRPVSIGTFPKEGAVEIVNFDRRTFVEDIGREAWGLILYNRELDKNECDDWELVPEGTAIDRKELENTAGKILMANGYTGREALEFVRNSSIEELKALVA